jgi:hypothetical protein
VQWALSACLESCSGCQIERKQHEHYPALTHAGVPVQEALREAAAAEALAAIAAAGDNGHSIEVPPTQVGANAYTTLLSTDGISAVVAGCTDSVLWCYCIISIAAHALTAVHQSL